MFSLFLAESPAASTRSATLKHSSCSESSGRVHDVQGFKANTEHEGKDETVADLIMYPCKLERMSVFVYSYTTIYQCITSCLYVYDE